MSEGSTELTHHIMRALRHNCEVTFRYRREWLGIGVHIRKEHEGMIYDNTKIIADLEMALVSEPMQLLAHAVSDLTNSILDTENAL